MLRIRHDIRKNLALSSTNATLRDGLGEQLWVRRPGLAGQWAKSAPGIELTTAPVDVGGPDVPATEVRVGLVDSGPGGQQRERRVGELPVADVGLMLQAVVAGDKLCGAEVGRLEEAWGMKVSGMSISLY